MQISFQKDTFPESSRYKVHIIVDKSTNHIIIVLTNQQIGE